VYRILAKALGWELKDDKDLDLQRQNDDETVKAKS